MRSASATDNFRTLAQLDDAIHACRRCDLYRNATQAVPGEGRRTAELMLVGEQPGNEEDLSGRPFVGPAGRVLDAALAEAGIDRRKIFVTNAVKHFKFEPRGKRRLHKRPNAEEIRICSLWNEWERKLLKPKLTVALGATAARSLMGTSKVTIAKLRGRIIQTAIGNLVVTVHPSLILRIPEKSERRREFNAFVKDLKFCRNHLERVG